MSEDAPLPSLKLEHPLIDSVLLIDADNDPHIPPDYLISDRALVRLFLRTDAKAPRGLERKLAGLPFCVTVRSTKGGANASDFGMSLHAGILHATLPMHIPFTFVTADKALGVMVEELQRLGRVAAIWSSHPERGGSRTRAEAPARKAPAGNSRGSSRGRGRGRGRARVAPVPAAVSAAPAETGAEAPVTEVIAAPVGTSGAGIERVTATYAARLARVKGPPSRVKALLNDIKNRAGAGHTPEQILEELKRRGAVAVDDKGRVQYPPRG